MIKVEKTAFEGWNNCLKATNGKISVVMTTDIGPRIIGFSCEGGKNVMAVVPSSRGYTGGGEHFIGYGGHRLWYAPELEGITNIGDNTPIRFELTKQGAKLFSHREQKTGVDKSIEVVLGDDNSLLVRHTLVNNGEHERSVAAWGITMFDLEGLLVVPHNTRDSGYMSNRSISLWSYSNMNDPRVDWGGKFVSVKQDKTPYPFKFGMSVEKGWAACFVNSALVVKTFPHELNAKYANGECNFESYVCKDFIEIESIKPLVSLKVGESVSYDEVWHIFDDVSAPKSRGDEDIEDALKPAARVLGI